MDPTLRQHIENYLGASIKSISSISGGDISQVYKLETHIETSLIKLNSNPHAFEMFKAETIGLEAIRNTKTIAVPEVKGLGLFGNTAYLLLSYIDPKSVTSKNFEQLGIQLANLHKTSSELYGIDSDNFIGSLPQSNKKHDSWINFYVHERIAPQLKLAQSNELLQSSDIPDRSRIIETLEPLFSNAEPSLLHGDLWSGNYLISKDGLPYLIDPAVYFGHHEVDIAMSLLFGGFGQSFYDAYHQVFPLDEGSKHRIEIYQLYYLLVHLNLFGPSYYGSVSRILKAYF